MTEIFERRISHRELTVLVFRCSCCKGEVTIDLANKVQRESIMHASPTLRRCPYCSHEYDSGLLASFGDLRMWLDRLADCGQEIIFCLREEIPSSPSQAPRKEAGP